MLDKLRLLLLFHHFILAKSDVFFLAHDYEENKYYCITNNSSALTWIGEDDKVSSFLPTRVVHPEWKFTAGEIMPKWAPVLDRRWESLSVYKSVPVSEAFEEMNFPIIPIPLPMGKNFHIPFSLRTQKEAHLILCDGDNVTKSNCYWFLIGGSNGTGNAVRKCNKGEISPKYKIPNEGSCRINISSNNKVVFHSTLLSKDFWSHFEIFKEDKIYTLRKLDHPEDDIISFEDDDFNISRVFVHSKMVTGFWKFHVITPEIFIEEETSMMQIGSFSCLNFFLLMCAGCRLRVEIIDAEEPNLTLLEKEYTEQWSEIKLVNPIIKREVSLAISTIKGTSSHPFWAIDDFRECSQNEFRIINGTRERKKCQLLAKNPKFLVEKDAHNITETISHFIPKSLKEDLKLQFTAKNKSRLYAPVLDRRWEKLMVHKTSHASNNEEMEFVKVDSFPVEMDFRIPFSLRTEKEAHLFLCDGNSVTQSNCYWILLGVKNEIMNAVRKCTKGQVSPIEGTPNIFPCTKNIINNNKIVPLSNEFWSHYEILREDNRYTLKKLQFNDDIILFEDSDFEVSHFFVHNKMVTGLWKFHVVNPSIYYVGERKDEVTLGPFEGPFLCLNFFVMMCEQCQLELKIVDTNKPDKIINTTVYRGGETLEWVENRFTQHYIESQVNVLISTITVNSDNPFWAIDELRMCSQNEFRMIRSGTKRKCQLLAQDKIFLLEDQNVHVGRDLNTFECPSNTVTTSCVPCLWSPSQKCGRVKTCDENHCTCSDGYLGKDCSTKCPDGTYGRQCRKACSCNYGTCHFVDGTCHCRDNYSGAHCEIEPATILAEPPVVAKIDYTTAQLIVHDFTLINETVNNKATFFVVEIKTENQEWQSEKNYNLHTPLLIDIPELTPGTQYFARFVVIGENGQKFSDNRIPITNFTTSCDGISENNVDVVPTNISVTISVKTEMMYRLCPHFQKLAVSINATGPQNSKNMENGSVFFDNLTPTTYYEVTVRDFKKTFQTLVENRVGTSTTSLSANFGINTVEELLVYTKNETSISLRWRDPFPRVPGYQIKYGVCNDNSSILENVTSAPCLIWNHWENYHCYTLQNLKENWKYCIKVGMEYKDFENYSWSAEIQTVANKDASKAPYDLLVEWSSNYDLELTWKHPNETNGDIKNFEIIIKPVGSNSGIMEKVQVPPYNLTYKYKIDAYKIQPSTKYELSIEPQNAAENGGKKLIREIERPLMNETNFSQTKYNTDSTIVFISSLSAGVLALVVITSFIICFSVRFFRKKSENNEDSEDVPLTTAVSNEYYAVSDMTTKFSNVVKVEEFPNYVKTALEKGELIRQHKIIMQYASKSDYERIETGLFYDYVGVNFNNDKSIMKAYIVAVVPEEKNVNYFWKTIWDENVSYIIYLHNEELDKNKFAYWPKETKPLLFEDMTIKLESCKSSYYYKHRKFSITRRNGTRTVDQLCFTSWLGNVLPKSAYIFVPFFTEMSKIVLDPKKPILVHSSYGMQGTGFAMLCDICFRKSEDGSLDPFNVAQMLSTHSRYLVSNAQHYMLAHLTLLELFLWKNTCISCEMSRKNLVDDERIETYVKYLTSTLWLDESVKIVKSEGLSLHTQSMDHDYAYIDKISAITINSFENRTVFAAKEPTLHNIVDFWKFVEAKNVGVIMSLNRTPLSSEEFIWYPNESGPKVLNITNHLLLNHRLTTNCDFFLLSSMTLRGNKNLIFEIHSLKKWPPEMDFPDDIEIFVKFCMHASGMIEKSGSPIVVMCRNGIKGCGSLIAMIHIIQIIKSQGVCDIYSAVRLTKSCLPNYLKEEQFSFLWNATKCYLDIAYSQQTSSN